MKKFEYLLLNTDNGIFKGIDYQNLNNQLTYLGAQGWEVVSTVSVSNTAGQTANLLTTCKRELPE
ncbi:MAG: DUF4177 domain-containing protein [Janthinobacterium lividum]